LKNLTGVTRRIIILLVVLLVGGSLTGCSATEPTTVVEEKYIPVEVEAVGKKTLVNTAMLSGKVSSETEVTVVPEVSGKVESVSVKVGDFVNRGAVLFTLDTSDMRETYAMAEARYQNSKELWDAANASLERTKTIALEKLANAKQNLANTKALFEVGAVSKAELDQTELAFQELESTLTGQIEQLTVQASDSSLNLTQLQLSQARDALDNAIVTAPVGGIVSKVNVTVGNMASSAQPALSLTDSSNLYSSLSVAENLVNRLTAGNTAKVTVSSVSGDSILGKIDHISPSSDPQTQLYPIKISLDNTSGLIKPGMFTKVELTIEEKADVLAIYSEAVILKNDKTIVYVVEGDKAVAKEVVTGLDTGVEIEILKGLNLGDKVIIKGQTLVDEGHKVKVVVGGETS